MAPPSTSYLPCLVLRCPRTRLKCDLAHAGVHRRQCFVLPWKGPDLRTSWWVFGRSDSRVPVGVVPQQSAPSFGSAGALGGRPFPWGGFAGVTTCCGNMSLRPVAPEFVCEWWSQQPGCTLLCPSLATKMWWERTSWGRDCSNRFTCLVLDFPITASGSSENRVNS